MVEENFIYGKSIDYRGNIANLKCDSSLNYTAFIACYNGDCDNPIMRMEISYDQDKSIYCVEYFRFAEELDCTRIKHFIDYIKAEMSGWKVCYRGLELRNNRNFSYVQSLLFCIINNKTVYYEVNIP